MVSSGVNQFDVFASKVDEHPITKSQVGHRGLRIRRLENFRPCGSLTDEESGGGEDATTGDVIIMVVTIDHIADGLIGEFFDLGLQPGRRVSTDRVGNDDALRGGDENRLMKFMPKQVEVIVQLGDFIVGPGLLSRHLRSLKQQASDDEQEWEPFRVHECLLLLRYPPDELNAAGKRTRDGRGRVSLLWLSIADSIYHAC